VTSQEFKITYHDDTSETISAAYRDGEDQSGRATHVEKAR
jgi:hypothetical protein